MKRVLVTRPQPDADATAGRLRAAGFEAVVDPLLSVEPIPEARLPDGAFDAVALTSVNGARALAVRPEIASLHHLPLYAVGRRTAAAAPPFADIHIAGGDGAALVRLLLREQPPGARVLHVAGEERAVDLPSELADAGIEAALFVIYRTVPASVLAPATLAAAQARRIDAAFHFSPRTAATLAGLAQEAGMTDCFSRIIHLCFSDNVAAPLAAMGWPTRIADAPTEDALFALLAP